MDEHNDERSFTRNAAINFIGGAFAPIASLATAPILAHALGVVGRGELAAATTPLALVVTASTLGLPEAVTYFVSRQRESTVTLLRRGTLLIVPAAIVATVALVLLSSWVSGSNKHVRDLIVLSAVFVAPSLFLSVVRGAAAAHNRWGAITFERMLTAASKLFPLAVLFVTGRLDVSSAAITTFCSTVVGVLVYLPLLFSRWRRPSRYEHLVTNRDLLTYGTGIWLGSVSGIILMRIDQVLLSPLSNTAQLGLYAVAVSISEAPLIANSAIRETAFTYLSGRGFDVSRVGELSRISTLIVIALCIPVGLLSPIVLPLVFGSEFSASVPVLIVLLIAVSVANPGSIAGVGLSSAGLPHLRSLALVAACVVNIVALLLLGPAHGAIGAAIATLAGNLTSSNLCILSTIRRKGATISDFYAFRTSDFARLANVPRLIVSRFRRRGSGSS